MMWLLRRARAKRAAGSANQNRNPKTVARERRRNLRIPLTKNLALQQLYSKLRLDYLDCLVQEARLPGLSRTGGWTSWIASYRRLDFLTASYRRLDYLDCLGQEAGLPGLPRTGRWYTWIATHRRLDYLEFLAPETGLPGTGGWTTRIFWHLGIVAEHRGWTT
jgi:hypothetical protein